LGSALALAGGGAGLRGYVIETTVPAAAGCPAANRWNVESGAALQLQWSTSIPQWIVSAAGDGSAGQIPEVQGVVEQSIGAWTGVPMTGVNPVVSGVALELTPTSVADSCTNDAGTNVDGVNTICFNQTSEAFTEGVLAFTRVITANAPGVSVGSSATASFAGQILDSDTLFNNTGQVTFATPGALASTPGAYDLATLLTHELGNYFGLDNSAIRRAIMFPFAPPPGSFIGSRPGNGTPDAQLSDDDRTGLRVLYPDAADSTTYVGVITGRIVPANPFALASFAATSPGAAMTGIFGTQVVAVDANSGQVIAGTLGGWSCNAANPVAQFDGSYRLERLPMGRSYQIYVEPLDGLATGANFYETSEGVCGTSEANACVAPEVDTNFTTRVKPVMP